MTIAYFPEQVDHKFVRPEVGIVDEVVADEEVIVELSVDEGPLVTVGSKHDGHRGVIAVLEHLSRSIILLVISGKTEGLHWASIISFFC